MSDVLGLTAKQILAIHEPEALFGKPELVIDRYHQLVKRWHPDMGGNHEVFVHIVGLHKQAETLIEAGKWRGAAEFTFTAAGKTYALKYHKSYAFELGHAYLSNSYVTYCIDPAHADFAEQARVTIENLRKPNEFIRASDAKSKAFDEVMRMMDDYLPKLQHSYTADVGIVLMISKPAELIRMRDLLEYCHGAVDANHVAWMISRLLHHASFLEYAGLTHNDLSMDTLFVNPRLHTVSILGGWWYATMSGEKLKGLPQRSFNIAPGDMMRNKLAVGRLDIELIKLTGRELLGDPALSHATNGIAPPKIVNWLKLAANDSAQKEYEMWREHILGPRRFATLSISASDVYPAELSVQ